jgi:hypothetical protein
MKLTIAREQVALYPDSVLSIEKLSPVLNEKVGSFSYPFTIPTQPNQLKLGWPGKLERTGDLPSTSFVLEDQGIQVLRGEIEYDTISREDISLILTTGITEFYGTIDRLPDDASSLSDIDFGNETWFLGKTPYAHFYSKLSSWDGRNREENTPVLAAPFQFYEDGAAMKFGNRHNDQGFLSHPLSDIGKYYIYQLQFRAWCVLEKIFTHFGYSVITNQLREGVFKDLLILGRPFRVTLSSPDPHVWPNLDPSDVIVDPQMGNMEYSYFMPSVSTYDFIEELRIYMGLAYVIDDLKKEVRILQLKSVLSPDDGVTELTELSGWQHKEGKRSSGNADGGYSISYMPQDDPLDNRADYSIYTTAPTWYQMPHYSTVPEGNVVHIQDTGRDMLQTIDQETQTYWKQIGRLKPCTEGLQTTRFEFNIKVPATDYTNNMFSGPRLKLVHTAYLNSLYIYDMEQIYVSLYRGMFTNFVVTTVPYQVVPIPFMSADRFMSNVTLDLSTGTLLSTVFYDFIEWQNSNPRSFTKYFRMTLPQVMRLQWSSRYVVDGIKIILSKINYDIPFTGIVKVEGYVV